jgi:outer membrane lipoprotein-sorting protein
MKDVRASLINLLIMLLIAASSSSSCVQQTANSNEAGSGNPIEAKGELRSTPPYSTKEPERYRATMLTMSSLGNQTRAATNSSALSEQRRVVARDGEKRRVDYFLPGKSISLIQTPAGNYLLDPDRKIYAEVLDDAGAAAALPAEKSSGGFSPDELRGKSRAEARYKNLGAEIVNGRAATKYRVTPTSITGDAPNTPGVSLIWIDDELHMPIKQEIVSSPGTDGARWTMELREIETNVAATLFEVPAGYQKAPLQAILSPAPHNQRR